MTNEHNCPKIVSTCIHILLSVLKSKPLASFGFIGANTIDHANNFVEGKRSTKRFRIYKKAMENLIGQQKFHHSMDQIHSTYLMVNNNNHSVQDIINKAKMMFERIYPELENHI